MKMNIEKEREAFERHAFGANYDQLKANYDEYEENYGDRYPPYTYESQWESWLAAKAHDITQYKDLYKRAIVNAKKRKNQINWAHVAGLGVGSGRAVELCKELNIDPHATDMNAMVEAARGGNE